MVTELDNFRKKYPGYEDLSDEDLAAKLAAKYPDQYGDLPGKVAEAARPKREAKPKSLAVQASDLARPELTPEHDILSPLGNVAADMFGGFVGMGENVKEGFLNLPNVFAHPFETAKGVGKAIMENPATAAGSAIPWAAKRIPGIGMATAMGGQLADQVADSDQRHPADRFADIFTAGAGPVAGEATSMLANTKAVQAAGSAAKKAAEKVPGLREGVKVPPLIKGKLKDFAEEKAVHALNPTKAQSRMASKTLGRTLLDEDAIPWLGSPEAIKTRVEAAKGVAGEQIGELIDDAHAQLTYQPPAQPMVVPVGGRIEGPHAPSRELPRTFRYDEATAPKPSGRVVSPSEIADSLQPEINALRKVPGMEGAVGQMEKHLETLRSNRDLTLPQAQKLRQQIDESINWNKKVPDMGRAQEFLFEIRASISRKMNDVVGSLKGQDSLKNANRKYADLANAEEILEKSIPRGQSNQEFGLGEKLAAGVGATLGGAPGAVVGAVSNKAARTWGNAAAARAANKLYKGEAPMLGGAARAARGAYIQEGKDFYVDDQGRLIINMPAPALR